MIRVMDKHDPDNLPPRERYPRTAWMYLREGLAAAHRRRPVSFYLLLSMPFALILAAGLLDRSNVRQFTLGLGLLFAFFGVLMIRAIGDLFDITRSHLRAQRDSFRDTLGEPTFTHTLGQKVKQSQED
jgi:hypothetical protein